MVKGITKALREFRLTSLAVDNSTSVFLISFMIMLFGIISYNRMPKEQFPEVDWPTVYINTPYFGNSAKDIENLIARPIEKELQQITGIKDINSTSIQDFSIITVEFEADLEMEDVSRKVKDAVDRAKSELPTDLDQDPSVLEINLSDIPIMTINIAGDYSMDALREYAEFLQDEIEEVDEVSQVDIKGVMEREVKVDIDLIRMMSLQVSFQDVENAIASENLTMSGGEILKNNFRSAIRVVGEFQRVEEIENVIVKSEDQRPIYLKDFANVVFGYQDRSSYARSDGLPVVSLDVIKRRGKNLLAAADHIKEVLEVSKSGIPNDLEITIFNDQSVYTRTEVSNLENSIISGVILVTLVLLFFLGFRNATFVGIAIPLSMLMGILLLYLADVTMNIVVLFSLILALGLLVDNAIVVVENIYRHMQNGYDGDSAAKYGTGEVAWPIIASTATTLAAFAPLAFWPGIMGEFMKYLPITLIIVLSSSLFVALVINPVFTAKMMKVDKKADKATRKRKMRNVILGSVIMLAVAALAHLVNVGWLRNIMVIGALVTLLNYFLLRPGAFAFQNTFVPWLENIYDTFIRFALRKYNPFGFFFGSFALLIFALMLLGARTPKVEFFPSGEPIYVNAFIELPLGTDIEATNRMMQDIEQKVYDVIKPYRGIVEAALTQVGENTSDPNGPPEPGVTPHKARMTISFVQTQFRDGVSTTMIMEKIRAAIRGKFPGAKIVVDKNANGPPAGKPINIELRGDNMDTLALLSERLITYLNRKGIPGIEELKADVQIGKPEMIVDIDREAARRYELSTYAIANAIRTSVYGKEVSQYKVGEDEYPIQIRLDEKYRYNVTDLLNQKITFRNASTGRIVQVPISAVADVRYSSTYSSVKRKNLKRMITIFSNVLEGYTANEVVAQLREAMADYPMPEGFTYEFTGEQEQQAEDMDFLTLAFGIAVFSIFLILVTQFNSLTSPIIIILSVLFSTIGVFLGYATTGMNIVIVFTGVGLVSLAGVVVNNAIVLVDYINLLIKRKRLEKGVDTIFELTKTEVREAIIKGGATRLRPVLLTAITTILGLIPLAIGFNFNFFTFISDLDPQYFVGGDNTMMWGPMAWTIIYGLVFATFLTLVVVPTMYWLSYRLKLALRNIFQRNKTVPEVQTVTYGSD